MVIQTNRSRRRIARPAGSAPNSADRVVRNCRLVNVLTREIHPADIEISGSRIRRIVGPNEGRGRKALDAAGAFAVPGLMDAHLHTEATLLTLGRFAEAVLPGGTTSFFINPHEIANVLGLRGIQWMLRDAAGLPIRIFLISPCKVPTAPGLETSGAEFKRLQVREMAEWPGVVAFGEFNGDRLLAGDPRQREILQWVRPDGKILAGHAPGVLGEDVGHMESGVQHAHGLDIYREVGEFVSDQVELLGAHTEGTNSEGTKEDQGVYTKKATNLESHYRAYVGRLNSSTWAGRDVADPQQILAEFEAVKSSGGGSWWNPFDQ